MSTVTVNWSLVVPVKLVRLFPIVVTLTDGAWNEPWTSRYIAVMSNPTALEVVDVLTEGETVMEVVGEGEEVDVVDGLL